MWLEAFVKISRAIIQNYSVLFYVNYPQYIWLKKNPKNHNPQLNINNSTNSYCCLIFKDFILKINLQWNEEQITEIFHLFTVLTHV